MNNNEPDFDSYITHRPFAKRMFTESLMDKVEMKIKASEVKAKRGLRNWVIGTVSLAAIILVVLFGNDYYSTNSLDGADGTGTSEKYFQTANYRIALPQDWEAKTTNDGGLIMTQKNQEVARITVIPLEQSESLYKENQKIAIKEGLLPDSKSKITYYMTLKKSGNQQETHYYLSFASGGVLYDLLFDSKVAASTSLRIAKSFVTPPVFWKIEYRTVPIPMLATVEGLEQTDQILNGLRLSGDQFLTDISPQDNNIFLNPRDIYKTYYYRIKSFEKASEKLAYLQKGSQVIILAGNYQTTGEPSFLGSTKLYYKKGNDFYDVDDDSKYPYAIPAKK
ncbi:hypothetical protein EHS13_04105 [Paenibacillus psychroresistens]|uniref:Uncharacterized protein n=1 Tax=Paenibacillus psychroresistens TaxID=1778678 RepID=A0A6B8RFK6_9BACL|nr:hypothetical protein [Paenibacillus psychroresistens]QGQ94146.1 hypothetical protein EHS13_04105 [Paenibacillus psychroresistens]